MLHAIAFASLLFSAPVATLDDPWQWEEQAKFVPTNAVVGSALGSVSAISGDTAIVGSQFDAPTGSGTHEGSAYIYVKSGSGWQLQQKLIGPSPHTDQQFGSSVAILGDLAVVGAIFDSTFTNNGGAVYVYERSGGTWSLTAQIGETNPGYLHRFGAGVATDGVSILVGSQGGGLLGSGAGYVYVRSGGSWIESAALENNLVAGSAGFGYSVAILGDHALVGDAGHTFGMMARAGSVSHFHKAGASWILKEKIKAPLPLAEARFGSTVALSGERALIGEPWHAEPSGEPGGAAYVYFLSGNRFELEDVMLPSVPIVGLNFGRGIGLSGDVALIGAPGARNDNGVKTGVAFAFVRAGSQWSRLATIRASDGLVGDWFGLSVAIDGPNAVICSPKSDEPVLFSGSAYLFETRRSTGVSFCTTDGVGVVCPCGNSPRSAEGCANSSQRGAALTAVGEAVVGNDSLVLVATQAPSAVTGLFFSSGNAGAPTPFGDGLRCVSGNLRRLGVASTSFDGVALSTISLSQREGLSGGELRHYQYWFRDHAGPCGTAFNVSSGHSLQWQ